MRDEAGAHSYKALGAADDARDADAITVFSFNQAQELARDHFEQQARITAGHIERHDGPYTVGMALDAYFADRDRRGSKGIAKDRTVALTRIVPQLGGIELHRLTKGKIDEWHSALGVAGKLSRPSTKSTDPRRVAEIDLKDPDAIRARRATANRVLTILKAALNHAFREGHISSDQAWRRVKPFREVEEAIVRSLDACECKRLINSCPLDFRQLVMGALTTGCRYSELTRMCAGDFNLASATVTVRISKSGKPRHIALADEGKRLFDSLTVGKLASDLIFSRKDKSAWGPSYQQRPLLLASKAANIDPSITFHILRHSYASMLAMAGAPMGVIAAQLGHADTRMTEKHYAHLAPNYVAETIRNTLPSLGLNLPKTAVRLGDPKLASR